MKQFIVAAIINNETFGFIVIPTDNPQRSQMASRLDPIARDIALDVIGQKIRKEEVGEVYFAKDASEIDPPPFWRGNYSYRPLSEEEEKVFEESFNNELAKHSHLYSQE